MNAPASSVSAIVGMAMTPAVRSVTPRGLAVGARRLPAPYDVSLRPQWGQGLAPRCT